MSEKLYKPLLIDSVKATANLSKQIFVGFDGAVCGVGEKAYGVCDVETDSGQLAPVGVLGILLVTTGGAINIGDVVTSDANGKAVAVTNTEEANGYALDAASGANEVIRVVRGI